MTLRRNDQIRVTKSVELHKGRIFDLVRETILLPSGLEQTLTVVDHPGAVAVAAVDDEGKILLVRQYRHACGDWLLEIPAGRLEPGEDRLAAAMRELEEETGRRAASWELLCEFYAAPGFCSELLTIYVARGLVSVGADARPADHDEELEVLARDPSSLLDGSIRDAKTLIACAALARTRAQR